MIGTLQPQTTARPALAYAAAIEAEIALLVSTMQATPTLANLYPLRWLAIQLLEGDVSLQDEVSSLSGGPALLAVLAESQGRLSQSYGDELDVALADGRYTFVHSLVQRSLTRPASAHVTFSDKLDRIVTHRLLGIPIFLALMWGVFKLTTDVAGPLSDWVGGVIEGPFTNWTIALLGAVGLGGSWVESMLVGGVLAGVGGVLVFVPILLLLYLALAVLEDSGYMARAAFVMDRLMRLLGLHGKSFLPMIVGFGCSVPAVYATRTLENQKDRVLTALLVPFMSCSARLPVYVLIAAVFFPQQAGLVIFGLYLTGIVLAIGLGVLLKGTLFKHADSAPFVLELPPYRLPTLRNLWAHMWERTRSFLRKAWTIILATSLVVWLLTATPVRGTGSFANTPVADSAFAATSQLATPVFAPLGFASWETSGALITGFVAKEVVVSTMAQVYAVEEPAATEAPPTFAEDVTFIGSSFVQALQDTALAVPSVIGINLQEGGDEAAPDGLLGAVQAGFMASSGNHGNLAALAFMVFVLLYTPCMVTVVAMRHELGNRWMWFSIVGQFAVAWLAAFLVFQGGRLLGL